MGLSPDNPGIRFRHWRTSGGAKVDLLIENAGVCIPVEIKLHSTPSRSLVCGLTACMKDLGLKKGFVIYPGEKEYSLGNGIMAIPAEEIPSNPGNLLDQGIT